MGHGDLRQGGSCSSAAAGCRRATALPVDLLAELPGGPWVALGGAMLTVEASAGSVERRLAAGELSCPCCSGMLAGWGHARARALRGPGGKLRRLRPRRARCRSCRVTHVLLAVFALVRRADTAEVIGVALEAAARGAGFRSVAEGLGIPAMDGAGLAALLRAAGWAGPGVLHRFAGRGRAGSGDAGGGWVAGGGCGGGDRRGGVGGGGAVAATRPGAGVAGRVGG